MLKIYIQNNELTPESRDLLNATVLVAKPVGLEIIPESIDWKLHILSELDQSTSTPVIQGSNPDELSFTPKTIAHPENEFLELTGMTIDGPQLPEPVNYRVTPLTETYILAKLEEMHPGKPVRETQSQLSACSKLIQEMYKDDEDYVINKPVPKVFFSKLDLDFYMSRLAVTLEESILLWMESTGRFSVNMNDQDILVPHLLENYIKRIYMFGPARNKVKVEFHNDDIHKDFSLMTPSVQLELCNEILSILPE